MPKKPEANLAWRANILQEAAKDVAYQKDLYTACAISRIFWLNAFCWTYRQKMVDPATGFEVPVTGNNVHVPFITYEIQDEALDEIERCMDLDGTHGGSQDALINKSRDMGATWLIVASFHHPWTFRDGVNILWVSATASDVDMHPTINPDTIFYKHDYLNYWMPEWMRPVVHRRNMHLGNKLRGNSLDGEATTANVGRGGRRTAIGFDEFAAVDDGEGMLSASSDTTPCRIFNSTPKGPGTAFTKIYKEAKAGTKRVKLIQLPWWEHPEKGKGREIVEDPLTREKKYTSPWYRNECSRRSSPQEIAQNLDMDHLDSGSRFFDGLVIVRHRSSYKANPLLEGDLDFDSALRPHEIERALHTRDLGKIKLSRAKKRRRLALWTHLVNQRPDQAFSYTIGIDISNGQGASNSVASIRCDETGEKVAEWADAETPPHDFARIVCALGIWFGSHSGKGYAKLIWETNGPGGIFGREIMRLGYPNVYMDRQEGVVGGEATKKYGWGSTKEKKAVLLGLYRRQLARDEYINHSAVALEEAEEYIYYETGSIGPARLLMENESARATHGDRVIADALTCLGSENARERKAEQPEVPGDSYAARKQRRRAALKEKRDRWRSRRR